MACDIAIRFDTSKVYLFENNEDVVIPINAMTDNAVLKMVLWLIKRREMVENIRNAENKILFRVYKRNIKLNAHARIFRQALWVQLPLCTGKFVLARVSLVTPTNVRL